MTGLVASAGLTGGTSAKVVKMVCYDAPATPVSYYFKVYVK
jgi:hypothetical protein